MDHFLSRLQGKARFRYWIVVGIVVRLERVKDFFVDGSCVIIGGVSSSFRRFPCPKR